MNSVCVVCGIEFSQHAKYQRKTCSKACHYNLLSSRPPSTKGGKKNYKPDAQKPIKLPKPPKPPRPEPHRKLTETKTVRSSFTEGELNLTRLILTTLNEFPRCKCENSERKMRIEPMGDEFKASCEYCSFEAVTVGWKWIGVETVRVKKRKPIAYGRGGEET